MEGQCIECAGPPFLFVVGEISFRPPENTSHPVIPKPVRKLVVGLRIS